MIAAGHPPEKVWDYTPYQAIAFARLVEKRERKQRARLLQVTAMARADIKEVNAQIRKDGAD